MSDKRVQANTIAFKASILHFTEDPNDVSPEDSYEYIEDGMLIVKNGKVVKTGEAALLSSTLPPETPIVDYSGRLIMPGFVDTHIHYPQTSIIASNSSQLLHWLDTYTFPEERKFSDYSHGVEVADFFTDELLKNGTTTALVMGTVHKESAEAFFEVSQKKNLRMIAGKVMMDRNAPEYLLDTPEAGYEESKALIEKWHEKGRLHYAVTPRFAPTSTEKQLELAGELFNEYPRLYMHTHLSENLQEIELVKELFGWSSSYLNVYEKFGLLNARSVFAHSIHLDDADYLRLKETQSSISFCPTSNLFLGSGLFNMEKAVEYRIKTSLGTDVGGGTSFSMLKTMAEAFKVCQLSGHAMSALSAFYTATLGGARALYLDDTIGTFTPGREADFSVINLEATPLMKRRMEHASELEEKLFSLMIMGDDRNIEATYVMGEKTGN